MMKKTLVFAALCAVVLAVISASSPATLAQTIRVLMIRGIQAANGDSLVNDTADSLKATLYDATGTAISTSVDATHDTAFSTWTGPAMFGYASSSVPTAVTTTRPSRVWTGLNGQVATMLVDSAGSAVSVGGGTQYDEDTVHSSGDKLNLFGVVRQDTLSALAADGDRTVAKVDDLGRVYVVAGQYGSWTYVPQAGVEGGCDPHSIISAASVNETQIKGTTGQIYSLVITNVGSTAVYFKLYNDTAANVDQTDTPVQRYAIPGSTTGAGISIPLGTGMAFSTGITYRITSGIADSDTGAIGASTVLVSACFK